MFSLLRTTVTRTLPRRLARPPTAYSSFLYARSQSTFPSDSSPSLNKSDNADNIHQDALSAELEDPDEIYDEALNALESLAPEESLVEQDSFYEEEHIEELPDTPPAATHEKIPRPRDPLLEYFVSALVRHGHRTRAQTYVTRTLLNIHTLTRAEPLPILREAILIASPAVKVMTKKIPTKNVPVPRALNDRQRAKIAVRWILDQSAKRKGPLAERLAREIIDVVRGNSEVLRLKTEMHKTAMVNRSNRM